MILKCRQSYSWGKTELFASEYKTLNSIVTINLLCFWFIKECNQWFGSSISSTEILKKIGLELVATIGVLQNLVETLKFVSKIRLHSTYIYLHSYLFKRFQKISLQAIEEKCVCSRQKYGGSLHIPHHFETRSSSREIICRVFILHLIHSLLCISLF